MILFKNFNHHYKKNIHTSFYKKNVDKFSNNLGVYDDYVICILIMKINI